VSAWGGTRASGRDFRAIRSGLHGEILGPEDGGQWERVLSIEASHPCSWPPRRRSFAWDRIVRVFVALPRAERREIVHRRRAGRMERVTRRNASLDR
jgi:hypothetical protein